MRKLLALMLCLALILPCLSAGAEETDRFHQRDPIAIEWLAYNTYGQPDAAASKVIQTVQEKYNINLSFWFVDDQQWDEVLGVRLASGEMPDIMKIKNVQNTSKYQQQGILAEITPEMLAKMPAYVGVVNEYDVDDNIWVDATVDGKIYALKGINLGSSYPTTLIWRLDWLKNVGIDETPVSIDEWETALRKVTFEDPDQNGKNDTFGISNTVISAVFGAFGAIPLKEFRGSGTQNLFMTKKDDKMVFAATQPESKQALELLARWYAEGLIDPEFITGENTGGYWAVSQAFENNKVAVMGMSMANHWNPPLVEGAAPGACLKSFLELHPDAVFGETVIPGLPPVGPEGKSGAHTWGVAGGSFGITAKGAENPDKLDVLLQMIEDVFADFDYATMVAYGFAEEDDYSIIEGMYVSNPQKYTDTAASTQAGLNVLNATISNPEFAKRFNEPQYAFLDQWKTNGYMDEKYPAVPAQDQYLADLKTYTLQTYVDIITGTQSVDSFDSFAAKFNEQGGKQIEDEINAAMGL
ncbi:lipoprotein LipO [Clostridia bacterium]|nr:lipoprotein LipO [Clostridia bacterium]